MYMLTCWRIFRICIWNEACAKTAILQFVSKRSLQINWNRFNCKFLLLYQVQTVTALWLCSEGLACLLVYEVKLTVIVLVYSYLQVVKHRLDGLRPTHHGIKKLSFIMKRCHCNSGEIMKNAIVGSNFSTTNVELSAVEAFHAGL